jgi:hypothetical protein
MDHPVTWTELLGIPHVYSYFATGLFVMAILLFLAFRARSALQTDSAIVPDASLSPRTIFELLVEGIGSF